MSGVITVRYEDNLSWELLPFKQRPLGLGSNGNYKVLLEYTLGTNMPTFCNNLSLTPLEYAVL